MDAGGGGAVAAAQYARRRLDTEQALVVLLAGRSGTSKDASTPNPKGRGPRCRGRVASVMRLKLSDGARGVGFKNKATGIEMDKSRGSMKCTFKAPSTPVQSEC